MVGYEVYGQVEVAEEGDGKLPEGTERTDDCGCHYDAGLEVGGLERRGELMLIVEGRV